MTAVALAAVACLTAAPAAAIDVTSPPAGFAATVGQRLPIAWGAVETGGNADPSAKLSLVIVSCPNNLVDVR
jgi:hypothetical protein